MAERRARIGAGQDGHAGRDMSATRTPPGETIERMEEEVRGRTKARALWLQNMTRQANDDSPVRVTEACIAACVPGSYEWHYWTELRAQLVDALSVGRGAISKWERVVALFELQDQRRIDELRDAEKLT